MTPFTSKLAAIAEDQFNKYHLHNEGESILCGQIHKYWTDLGFTAQSCTDVPWSAVFVSWCIKKAGATSDEFRFAESHSVFMYAAIQNAMKNSGLFRGVDITAYAPQIGDIIQNNRSGNRYDYDYAKKHAEYESHSAIVVETGNDRDGLYALTIGGNESDSIRQKRISLTSQGFIRQRTTSSYIAIIKNLK